MHLLFVHDVKAELYNDEVFARSYGYEIWRDRYLPSFEDITVLFRTRQSLVDLNGKTDKSSGQNVFFDKRIGMFSGPEVFISSRIKNVIRDDINRSDAVIVRLDSFLGLQTIRECHKLNKPYLIELVGCAWDSFWNHGLFGKILAPYIYLRTKKEVYDAPFVVYVTNEFLQKRYPTKGINTNISNVKLFKQQSSILNDRLSKISTNRNNTIVLGTAANVDVRYKGQQYVIKALARLKKLGYTNFVYQVLGAGDQTYLKKVAKDNDVENSVVFLGSYPHERVFEWLTNEIDVYIQPSLQEGLPRSVIEAMSVGLPCIGSNVAGIPELLDEKCVFKIQGSIINNIVAVLRKLSVDMMSEQSVRNFNVAQQYDYSVLLKRRFDFLTEFKKSVSEF